MSPGSRRPGLAHPARVAAVTTLVIALVYLSVAGVLDSLATRRLSSQVDHRLSAALMEGAPIPLVYIHGASGTRGSGSKDLDDAPVIVWLVSRAGTVLASSAGAPPLAPSDWSYDAAQTSAIGQSHIRIRSARATGGDWLVVGQSLAEVSHVRSTLVLAEAVVLPVMLVAIYLGALTIGVQAAAPVERTRRRQLEFTADASHELRTPLSVIEAEVELALSAKRPEAYYRSSLERVSDEGQRLRRIVDDLLWLARFDSEPAPPGDEPMDLVATARICTERFASVARSRDIDLSLEADESHPALMKAPPEWVDRLAGVLVDNACRYARGGGHVLVAVTAAGSRVSLVVEDDGPGIDQSQLDRLFDRFHRASDQVGGAGLGLAIADAVVQSTGGRWKIGASGTGGARMEVSWHRAGSPDRLPAAVKGS